MAVLATIVSGGYTCVYDTVAMGQQEDGFRLRLTFSKEEIKTASYGDMAIDAVYKGGNCYIQGVFIESQALAIVATASPFNPYKLGQDGVTHGLGFTGVIGRFDFELAKALVLTAISTLPAASSIATLTASHAIVDHSLTTEIVMANRARSLNTTFRLYPFVDSTNIKWFAVT